MDKSGVSMGENMDGFLIIQRYLRGLGVSLPMVVFLATFLIVAFLFLLWFALREVKLWYWKTDTQIETLKKIELRLANLEVCAVKPGLINGFDEEGGNQGKLEETEEKTAIEVEEPQRGKTKLDMETINESVIEKNVDEDIGNADRKEEETTEQVKVDSKEHTKDIIGRSGKVYTEEELERQILE